MSSKTTTRMSNREAAATVSSARPKTLNRGAADATTRILAYLRKRNDKVFAKAWKLKKSTPDSLSEALQEINASLIDAVYSSRSEDITWIEDISERANKRKGGLGRK